MQDILEAGSAAEGHNNSVVVPSNQNLTETYRMLSLLDPYIGEGVSTDMYKAKFKSAEAIS